MQISISKKQLEVKQKILDDPQVVEALVGGAAGFGKSFVICISICLMNAKYPGIQIALGRKTLKELEQSTIATLLGKVHPMFGIGADDFRYDRKMNIIEYKNGTKITLINMDYEPSDPDFTRYGSLEFDWGFIDEAGEITKQAKDVLKGRLGRGEVTKKYRIPPKLFLASNPSTNFVRTEYYQPYKTMGGGEFQKWQIGEVVVDGKRVPAYRAFLPASVKDNPFIDENYIESLKQLPDRERKRLLDGNWDYNDNDRMLFTGELIEKSTIRAMPEMSISEKCDLLFGVDIADAGNDDTVVSVVQNNILIKQIAFNTKSAGIGKDSRVDIGDFITDKIIRIVTSYGLTEKDAKRITIETNGVGASVRDNFRRKKWYVNEYTADSVSRGKMYYSLQELMVDGKVLIYEEGDFDYIELKRQLSALEYDLDGTRIRLTDKKKLRKLLGRSPDMADSFAIALNSRGSAAPQLEKKTINYFTSIRL